MYFNAFDAVPVEMDLASRESILALLGEARKFGEISMLVNAAGVSPSQASVEAILQVDLYGTAVLLEEVGKVIKTGAAWALRLRANPVTVCPPSAQKWMNNWPPRPLKSCWRWKC